MFEFIFLIFCISAKCERRGWLRVEDANKPFPSTASKSQEGVTQTLGILNPCDSLTPAWGESETDLNIHPKPCSAGPDAFGGQMPWPDFACSEVKDPFLVSPIFSHFSKCFHCGW